ncbi:unnamed protein product, partial [Symbiodinium pilosum]
APFRQPVAVETGKDEGLSLMQMALEWLPALQEELEHLKANGVKIGGHVSQLRHHLDAIIPGCGNRDEALTLQSLLVSYEGEEDPDVDKNEVAIGIIMRDVQEERVMRGRCKRARMAQMDDDRALAEAMEKDA